MTLTAGSSMFVVASLALHMTAQSDPGARATLHEPAGRCRPGLQVQDLEAFHKRMVEHGVPCAQEPTSVFGARVAQYVDPDGLVISVGEERRGR